ncbi:hypothetical protein LOAG_14214 [Loa loa]|uniref:Inner centromere protein ARK-binding domain-containing protein n=2 Tax=Loa loa TaxID=7209 RepID=A0A1S0TJH8_LOALO|nr:hypothetical protein LOAG_14214 [Loa loa]EFO14308.1 hypothetical protein LOAG_14214 [Loa loa]
MIDNSSQILITNSNSNMNIEQIPMDIEMIEISMSCDMSQFHTSKQKDDSNIFNDVKSHSTSLTSINTASILERTRPIEKSTNITQRITNIIDQDEMYKGDKKNLIDNDDNTKRSTYLNYDLKYEQNIVNDDLRIMSMDLKSSSCQSNIIMDISEKRGKVTSTKFPSQKALDELDEQEYTRICHSINTKEKSDDEVTDYDIYDLSSSNEPIDPNEKPHKKIPLWAKEENVQEMLKKQQIWSFTDINTLFGKIHPPDMQKMFNDKIRLLTRSSSAIWESPIWNPRVGYSAYDNTNNTFQQNDKNECNIRRSQRVKKPVSYITYF